MQFFDTYVAENYGPWQCWVLSLNPKIRTVLPVKWPQVTWITRSVKNDPELIIDIGKACDARTDHNLLSSQHLKIFAESTILKIHK